MGSKVTELKPEKVSTYDDSFRDCINHITGVDKSEFQNIDTIIKNFGMANWYKPYVEVLQRHGLDIIFFSYGNTPIQLIEEITSKEFNALDDKLKGEYAKYRSGYRAFRKLENYEFNQLPTGKCMVLGRDSDLDFRCVTANMKNHKISIAYDPNPSKNIAQIFEIGYFIKTFID